MRNQKMKIRNYRIRDFEVTDGKELLQVRHTVQDEYVSFVRFVLAL
jgi:hypothetical protein